MESFMKIRLWKSVNVRAISVVNNTLFTGLRGRLLILLLLLLFFLNRWHRSISTIAVAMAMFKLSFSFPSAVPFLSLSLLWISSFLPFYVLMARSCWLNLFLWMSNFSTLLVIFVLFTVLAALCQMNWPLLLLISWNSDELVGVARSCCS